MEHNLLPVLIFLFLILSGLLYLLFRGSHFKKLSMIDDLTGLMNYRGLRIQIKKIIRNCPVFTLVLIDIDNFKSFNKQGYSLGDEVLKEFISFLKKTVPDDALIVRFRIGDEFIIILKNTNQPDAEKQISSIRTKCLNHSFHCLNQFTDYGISFTSGIVQYTNEYNSLEKLIGEAENRMNKLSKI